MPPSTRSGGVPAPSRVYHSTPSLHQMRFPARRGGIRTYGKNRKKRDPESRLNQSTLTQLNWAASSSGAGGDNGVVEFSDSQEDMDEEEEEEEKENGNEEEGDGKVQEEDEDEEDEDNEPVQSGRKKRQRAKQTSKQTFFDNDNDDDEDDGHDPPSSGKRRRPSAAATVHITNNSKRSKRRRTVGDEIPQNVRRAPGRGHAVEKGRRKTLEDLPVSQDQKGKTKRKKVYHTQTITQVVRDFSMIKDSEDEDEDEDEDQGRDGFDEWVGAPSGSPSPRGQRSSEQHADEQDKAIKAQLEPEAEAEAEAEPRQESMVPQTPAKKQIRFEIPSSTQSSRPLLSARTLERYGPADQPQVTPSKGSAKMDQLSKLPGDASASVSRKLSSAMKSRRKLVIEDSFATTDSWGSTPTKRTPLMDVTASMVPLEEVAEEHSPSLAEEKVADENLDEDQTTPRGPLTLSKESSSAHESMSTPSKPPRRRDASRDLGGDSTPSSARKEVQPHQASGSALVSGKKDLSNVFEIPDSEDEDEDDDDGFWGEDEVKTQDQRASRADESRAKESKEQNIETSADDSAAAEESRETVSEETAHEEPVQNNDTFVFGAQTQGAFDELTKSLNTAQKQTTPLGTVDEEDEERIPQSTAASSQIERHVSQSPVVPSRTTRSKSASQIHRSSPATVPKLPTPKVARPIRKPIRYPLGPSSPTQIIESQRVPLSVIQALGEVSAQTDAFVIVAPPSQIEQLVSGHRTDLALDHRLPRDVVRLWLFGGDLMRYVACVEPGAAAAAAAAVGGGSGQWTYDIKQIYELNNPLDESDIDAEEWFNRFPTRWAKVPPAIVSQLLSNLKHALFNTDEDVCSTQGTTQPAASSPPRQLRPSQGRRTKGPTPSASYNSASVSQQVEAQLRSETEQHTQSLPLPSDDDILVPSTPVHDKAKTPRAVAAAAPPPQLAFTPRLPNSSTSKRHSARKTPRPMQPSQATTASQSSTTDEKHSHPPQQPQSRQKLPPKRTTPMQPPPPFLPSSSSLHLIELDSSPNPAVNSGGAEENIPISQLLTKSQMLSESLLADDVNMLPRVEMWASDDEV